MSKSEQGFKIGDLVTVRRIEDCYYGIETELYKAFSEHMGIVLSIKPSSDPLSVRCILTCFFFTIPSGWGDRKIRWWSDDELINVSDTGLTCDA